MGVLTYDADADDTSLVATGDTAADEPQVTPTTSTPAAVPAGWRTVGGTSAGYRLSLPPNWTDLPLDGATIDSLSVNQILKANPTLANALNGQLRTVLENGGKLFAFETSGAGEVNINLIATPSGGATLAQISAALPVEITDLGARDLRTDKVKLAAGEAFRLVYTLPLKVPGGPTVNIEQSQYIVAHGRQIFILTASTPNRARDGATLDAIAQTLSID